MRPINVTLCSTTWELAKQKANFSGWVRRKLMDEQRKQQKQGLGLKTMYESFCEPCDLWYDSSIEEKMLMFMCHECGKTCKYMGPSQ